MSRRRARDGSNEVRRRLAATAATAALAVGGGAASGSPASARPKAPPRPNVSRPSQVASRGSGSAVVEAQRREDLSAHRRLLATALADELGPARTERIERALAAIDDEMSDAYAHGERPDLHGGLQAEIGRRIGVDERAVSDAFEAMSRHALDRRRGPVAR
jgi:hypothetical protein